MLARQNNKRDVPQTGAHSILSDREYAPWFLVQFSLHRQVRIDNGNCSNGGSVRTLCDGELVCLTAYVEDRSAFTRLASHQTARLSPAVPLRARTARHPHIGLRVESSPQAAQRSMKLACCLRKRTAND